MASCRRGRRPLRAEARPRAATLLCTQCGHPNRPQHRVCAVCSGPLGGHVDLAHDDAIEETDARITRVVAAIEQLLTEAISSDVFVAMIDEMIDDLAKRHEALGGLEIPPLAGEAMSAEVDAGLEGLAWYCDGLARLRDFADTPERALLEEGLTLIEAAEARLQEALECNRQNRRRIEGVASDASTLA